MPDPIEERAKALYAAEYRDDPDDDGWDAAPGWEQTLFRRRAHALIMKSLDRPRIYT